MKAAMLLGEGGLAAREAERLIAAILGLVEDRPVRDLGLVDLMRPVTAPRISRALR